MNKRAKTDFMIAGFCIVVFVAITLGVTHKARSQDREAGHAEHHDVYKTWHTPGSPGVSCCNERRIGPDGKPEGDCYPTEAILSPSGGLLNLDIKGDVWWAKRFDGRWIEIPESRIVKEKNPDDTGSRAHLCQADNSEFVLCFVPPTGGS